MVVFKFVFSNNSIWSFLIWYKKMRSGVHLLTSCCRLSGLKVLLIPPICAHLIAEEITSDISLDNPHRLLLLLLATQVDSDVQLYLVFGSLTAEGRRKKLLDFNYRLSTREGSSSISPVHSSLSHRSLLESFTNAPVCLFIRNHFLYWTALLLPAVSSMDQMAYKLRQMNSH